MDADFKTPEDNASSQGTPYPYFEAVIGRLAMNFGALDVLISATIEDLDPTNPVLAPRQAFSSRHSALRKLVVEKVATKDSSLGDELLKLVDHILFLSIERGLIIHAAWLDKPGTDIDSEKTRLTRPNRDFCEIRTTPDEIAEVVDRVHKAWERLKGFASRLRVEGYSTDLTVVRHPEKFLSIRATNANTTPAVITKAFPADKS